MTPDATNPQNGATDAEPKADRSPAPITIIVIFALLVFWSMVYLDDHGGGFSPQVYQPYANYAMLNDSQVITDPTGVLRKEGERIFNANCSVCHQTTGVGNPANGCPPLVGSDWATGGGPNRIIRLVLDGGTGVITVKSQLVPGGQNYGGSTTMTPFKSTLSDHQIAAALTYVRSAWGNKASAVLDAQVKKIHDGDGANHPNWTPDQLKQIPDSD